MREYDSRPGVHESGPDAQRLLRIRARMWPPAIEITVDRRGERRNAIAADIQERRGIRTYLVEDWSRLWPNLFAALRLEKTVYFPRAAPDGVDRGLQYRLDPDHGGHGKTQGYCSVTVHGRIQRGSIRLIFLIKGWIIGAVGTLVGSAGPWLCAGPVDPALSVHRVAR